jgi:DeoR family transcriptional regulator of aga operon
MDNVRPQTRNHRDNPKESLTAPDNDSMLIEERRQRILAIAQSNGRVLVRDLSKAFGISQITIRKDLDYLQLKGLLQRSHGGALPVQVGALFDPPLKEKEGSHHPEKGRIAQAAAEMVQEGQCVMLDSGTTTTAVAHALKRFSRLTVITNAVNIAADLTGTDFEVILTGGILRKNSFSLVGPLAEDMLAEMHADILFLGVDGFDVEAGLTTPNLMESRVNRAMVRAASKTVAVCDSTKFNRHSFSRIVPPSAIHHVITDVKLPKHIGEALNLLNIGLTLV